MHRIFPAPLTAATVFNWLRCTILIGVLGGLACISNSAPLTLTDALNPSGIQQSVLSPDGKHIASIGFTGQQYGLLLMDVDKWTSHAINLGKLSEEGYYEVLKYPLSVFWITNSTLAINYADEAEAVDLDSNHLMRLGEEAISKVDVHDPDSPLVLMLTNKSDKTLAVANSPYPPDYQTDLSASRRAGGLGARCAR